MTDRTNRWFKDGKEEYFLINQDMKVVAKMSPKNENFICYDEARWGDEYQDVRCTRQCKDCRNLIKSF